MEHVVTLGDCLDPVTGIASLGDRSVDHACFDPPYSERVHSRLGLEDRADGTRARDALRFEALTEDVARRLAVELCRVTRRWILVFCDEVSLVLWKDSIEAAGGEYVRKGTWIKDAPMPQMSGDRPCAGTEEIVIAHAPRAKGSGRMKWNGGGRPATYRANPQEHGISRVHPAQKPLSLMEALLRDFTDRGDLVVDPFSGSGSTGVACKRLGRRFLGWERDAEYAPRAQHRIESVREQLSLLEGGLGSSA